jgi:hypothetical protein
MSVLSKINIHPCRSLASVSKRQSFFVFGTVSHFRENHESICLLKKFTFRDNTLIVRFLIEAIVQATSCKLRMVQIRHSHDYCTFRDNIYRGNKFIKGI